MYYFANFFLVLSLIVCVISDGACPAATSEVEELKILDGEEVNGLAFPLVLVPTISNPTLDHRLSYVRKEKETLLDLVRTHGAILLRGWGGCGPEHFSQITEIIQDAPHFDMSCSAGPRVEMAPGVFTANDAPSSDTIPFHHEMAQCDTPPSHICFFCETPATEGGETPMILSHTVVEFMRKEHPEVAQKLSSLGVRYVRVQSPETDSTSALGKGWKLNFQTESKREAEEKMRVVGTSWEWMASDYLKTLTRVMPALPVEESSGLEVFFTAAETTLKDCLKEEDILMPIDPCESGLCAENLRPMKAFVFGDGSSLDNATRNAFRDVGAFMDRTKVAFKWKAGDALIIDNSRVMHSRGTYSGPRKVYASLFGRLEKEPVLRPIH